MNTNRNRPLGRQLSLLRRLQPDVLCLQEFRQDCFDGLKGLGYRGTFSPQWSEVIEGQEVRVGSAILSAVSGSTFEALYFRGAGAGIPEFKNGAVDQSVIPRALQTAEFVLGGHSFRISNVHFTWSAGGRVSELQEIDAAKIAADLKTRPDFALFGDFNTPVGGDLFDRFFDFGQVAIPPGITSTLDERYHYASGVKIIVDGVFASNAYDLLDIQAVNGVSDHCAVVTRLAKR